MYQIIRGEEVDAIIVPLTLLSESLRLGIIHVSCHHNIPLSVPGTAYVCISGASLDASQLERREDGVTTNDVFPILSILTNGISSPLPLVAHVAIKKIVTFLRIYGL
jgi:hypothetical protein